MNEQVISPTECDPDIYKYGTSQGMFDMSKERADEFCDGLTAQSGRRHDWHYFGGRVHVLALPKSIEGLLKEHAAAKTQLDELQAEIDALKQQRDELLRALHNLTENVTFYHTYGISDLKDAKADRNNAVKIALIAIGIDFEPDLEFNDWQPLPITKAKGGQS